MIHADVLCIEYIISKGRNVLRQWVFGTKLFDKIIHNDNRGFPRRSNFIAGEGVGA
jgi:hypothetical protein